MEPHVPQKAPYAVEVEAGKSYFWCSCGQSSKQPFCDGSHKGSGFSPVKWEAPENKTVYSAAASTARTSRCATASTSSSDQKRQGWQGSRWPICGRAADTMRPAAPLPSRPHPRSQPYFPIRNTAGRSSGSSGARFFQSEMSALATFCCGSVMPQATASLVVGLSV